MARSLAGRRNLLTDDIAGGRLTPMRFLPGEGPLPRSKPASPGLRRRCRRNSPTCCSLEELSRRLTPSTPITPMARFPACFAGHRHLCARHRRRRTAAPEPGSTRSGLIPPPGSLARAGLAQRERLLDLGGRSGIRQPGARPPRWSGGPGSALDSAPPTGRPPNGEAAEAAWPSWKVPPHDSALIHLPH